MGRRTLPTALVIAALALLPLAPAAAVADDADRRWVSTGRPLTGATQEGKGPELFPGLYQDRFTDAPDAHWYVIKRVPGSIVFISAAYSVPVAQKQEVELEVKSPTGARCAHGPNQNPSNRGPQPDTFSYGAHRMVTTTVALEGAQPHVDVASLPECNRVDTLYLMVKRAAGSGAADIELQYIQQPMPREDQDLPPGIPPGQDEGRTAAPAANSAPVRGGGSFSQAAEIAPGSHTDTIRPGEQVFYRVKLDYGQSGAVTVDAPAPGEKVSPPAEGTPHSMAVSAYAPIRAKVDSGDAASMDGESRHLSVQLPRVEFMNMSNVETALSGVPGYHYVVVQLDPGSAGKDTTPVRIRLNVAVEGQARPAPVWATSGSTPTSTEFAAAVPAPVVHGSPWPWVLGVLGAAAAAGLAAGIVVGLRRWLASR